MGRYERQTQDSSPAQKPSSPAPSAADVPSPARVTLPNDLSGSLKYLDEAQLRTLLEAVTVEIDRRNQATSNHKSALAAAPEVSAQDHLVTPRNKQSGVQEIRKEKQISFELHSRRDSSLPPLPVRFAYPGPW